MSRFALNAPFFVFPGRYLCVLALIFAFDICTAQKVPTAPNTTDASGRRQGRWVILFNEDWKETKKTDSAFFYRLISYKDDVPAGEIADYHLSGIIQFKGHALQDRPRLAYDGNVAWYYETGAKRIEVLFEKGVFRKVIGAYLRNGKSVEDDGIELNAKALQLVTEEKYADASKIYEEALEHYEAYHTRRNINYIVIARNAIDNCFSQKDYQRATALSEVLVKMDRKILLPPDSTIISDIDTWALAAKLNGADKSFLESLYRLGIAEAKNRSFNPVYLDLIIQLGGSLADDMKLAEAIPLLEEGRKLCNEGHETSWFPYMVMQLSSAYDVQHRYEESIALIQESLPKLEKDPDRSYVATLTHEMSNSYRSLGRYNESIREGQRYISLLKEEKETDNIRLAQAYINVGRSLGFTGNLPEAEGYFAKAEKLLQGDPKAKPEDFFSTYLELADLYQDLGQFTLSLQYSRKALNYAPDDQSRLLMEYSDATTLLMKGSRRSAANKFNNLIASLEKKKNLSPEEEDTRSMLLMSAGKLKLFDADSLYNTLGGSPAVRLKEYNNKLKEVEAIYLKRLSLQPDSTLEDRQSKTITLMMLTEVYRKMENFKLADSLLQDVAHRAITLFPRASKQQISLITFCISQLQAENWRGYVAELGQLYRAAFELMRIYREQTLPYVPEKFKASFIANNRQVLNLFTSLTAEEGEDHPELIAQLYNETIRNKGLVLNTVARSRQIIAESNDPSLLSLFDQWKRMKNELALATGKSASKKDGTDYDIETLQKQTDELERQLSSASAAFTRLQLQSPVTWKDVAATLQPGEAAVEIIRAVIRESLLDPDTSYIALAIQHGEDSPKMIRFYAGKAMEGRALKYYRNAIRFRQQDTLSYKYYWRELATALPNARKVYLSPDGVFHQISISTLYNPKTKKYVLDECDVQMVTSTSELTRRSAASRHEAKDVVLVGFPEFGGPPVGAKSVPQDRSMDLDEVPPLPGTEKELSTVASLLKQQGVPFRQYMGMEATEALIKKTENPAVLHIATHGYFLKELPQKKLTAETLSEDNGFEQDPMLRSGLLLAQCCNKSHSTSANLSEDGILTAYEASTLTLDKTNLVILSACETGLGEVSFGEGVYGLQRAFFEAGVPSLLMSLWKVDDEATQQLMTEFYRQWLINKKPHEALRLAQKKLRITFDDPYYWGAFVTVGN